MGDRVKTPHLGLASNAGGVAIDGFGYAKVNELELPLHHQEVGWLQVTVHNPGFVDRMHSLHARAGQL